MYRIVVLLTGMVDSITPNKLKGLRSMLNSTALDILYYSSPLYRAEVSSPVLPHKPLVTSWCALFVLTVLHIKDNFSWVLYTL